MSALIFRIDPQQIRSEVLSMRFSDREIIESIVVERIGEQVALGASDVPGIWSILATGELTGLRRSEGEMHLDISNVLPMGLPIDVVTAGDKYADDRFSPYALDVLDDEEDLVRVFGTGSYQQDPAPRVLAAAESARTKFQGGVLYGGLHLEPQRPEFFHSVAAAYQWRCAFTGMSQASLDGRFQEGLVIGIDEPYEMREGPPSQGLFVSSSIAFCYRHGLLAIGEDYDILRHPVLGAEMRIFLETINRKALLVLPKDEANRPDLEAARRHRLRFGY